MEDHSTPLLDVTNAKLANPAFECCMLHSVEECELERSQDKQALSQSQSGFNSDRWGPSTSRSSGEMLSTTSALSLWMLLVVATHYLGYY